jgi:hypothetical protein
MAIELHPRNQGFDWTRAQAGPLSQAQLDSWNERGFFLYPDAFDRAEIDALVAELDPLDDETNAFLATRPNGKIFIAEKGNLSFTLHPVLRSPRARRFVEHPIFADLCATLIGPDARLYWDQAVYKRPERPRTFPWHQDNGYTYVEPQQYLTCWVALTDATVENGCPWVAPSLHKHGTLAHRLTDAGWECLAEDPPDAVPVEARAGSIVVFSSLTPHKTGPNTSDGVRKAYIVQFAPDGARRLQDGAPPEPCDHPERQFRIASPLDIAARAPEA